MATLLRIDASAGGERSVSRRVGDYFEQHWHWNRPGSRTSLFDLSKLPPPMISNAFIDAAYTPADELGADGRAVLAYSDGALREIAEAEAILITTPMYNFGLPGTLKAWFDQIIRIGVSFGITDDPTQPYVPLLDNKPVFVVTARGSADMVVGGALSQFDFLTPHLRTLLAFVGFPDPHFFDIPGTEAPPEQWEHHFDLAQTNLEKLAQCS